MINDDYSKLTLEKANELLKGSRFEGQVSIFGTGLMFSEANAELDLDAQWSNFFEIADSLEEFNLALEDAVIEPNTISGILKFKEADNEVHETD